MSAKFAWRNIFGEIPKTTYTDLRIASKSVESCGLAASASHIAVPWEGGGGVVGCLALDSLGVRKPPVQLFKQHKASVQDLAFSPFYDTIFASASDDSTVKIWDILPTLEVKQNALLTLTGHTKKVYFCRFNLSADWILATGGTEGAVKVWNLEKGSVVSTANLPESPFDLHWNYTGNLLLVPCRDKTAKVLDPRSAAVSQSFGTHEATKSIKACWVDGPCGNESHVITTGFSKSGSREYAAWDIRSCKSALFRDVLDRGAGPLFPLFDYDTGLLYACGRGDGNIRVFELQPASLHLLHNFTTQQSTRAFGFLPKRAVDTAKCELARCFRSESNSSIQPVSFIVPRKSGFSQELYPPTLSPDPALKPDDWINGINAPPKTQPVSGDGPVTFKPYGGKGLNCDVKESGVLNSVAALSKKLTMAECRLGAMEASKSGIEKDSEREVLIVKVLELTTALKIKNEELDMLRNKIVELEAKLTELGTELEDKRIAEARSNSTQQTSEASEGIFRSMLEEARQAMISAAKKTSG